jgi:holliday junction DNA helicase RuvA
MIGRLRGNLIEVEASVATVDVGGVGYDVTVPEMVLVQFPQIGEFVDLYIRQIFREDGVSLYGFLNAAQRRIFDLLIEVKGCGPKIAVALIGQVGDEAVAQAIAGQDARALTRATGVGPRLAERILLELKEKIATEVLTRRIDRSMPGKAIVTDELVDALLALGYRRAEAEVAADEARTQAEGVEEQLRMALRSLQR